MDKSKMLRLLLGESIFLFGMIQGSVAAYLSCSNLSFFDNFLNLDSFTIAFTVVTLVGSMKYLFINSYFKRVGELENSLETNA